LNYFWLEEATAIPKKIKSLGSLHLGAKLNPVSKAHKTISKYIPNSPMVKLFQAEIPSNPI
jgi:hypothetical protein